MCRFIEKNVDLLIGILYKLIGAFFNERFARLEVVTMGGYFNEYDIFNSIILLIDSKIHQKIAMFSKNT